MTYEKLYQIGFWIATLYALVMLPYNLERIKRVDTVEAKITTSTGILETEGDWSEDLRSEIQTIWTIIPQANAEVISKTASPVKNSSIRTPEQIYEQVKHLGYREEPTLSIIRACKVSSHDPRHCILVWLTLMYNEAGNKQNSKACIDRNNCFGIQSGKKKYSSLDEWSENWVSKYNRYWYKAQSANFFYSSAGKLSPSRYCTSEDSSDTSVGCPIWLSIATNQWEKLYKIIY